MLWSGVAPTDDSNAGTGWSLTRLDLELFVAPEVPEILYSGSLFLKLDGDRSLGPDLLLKRQLAEGLHFMEAQGARSSDTQEFEHDKRASLVSLRFPEPLERGAVIRVQFEYVGALQGSQILVDESIAFASWVEAWTPWPAPAAEPYFSAAAVRAPGTTTFHLPPNWYGVTGGERKERVVNGDEALEVWQTEQSVARSYCAGPYGETRYSLQGRDITVYLLEEKPTPAIDQAKSLADALVAMEAQFGPYPYASYAIAEVPKDKGHFGASSEQGFIMVKPSFLEHEGGNLALFAHEAAHGWWGNLIGQRGPGGLLCSESLAQYGCVIAIEALEGRAAATEFLRFSRPSYILEQSARGYFGLARDGLDMPLSEMGSGGHMHTLSDSKATWVYHMLRERIGDELFFGTLRGLIGKYGGKRMSLDDLRGAFIAASPAEARIELFFQQWLDRAGAPSLEATWAAVEGGFELRILQVQEQDPYDLELDVEFVSARSRRERLRISERETRFVFPGPAPSAVLLDPDHRLLIWHPDYGDAPSDAVK